MICARCNPSLPQADGAKSPQAKHWASYAVANAGIERAI
jgi:hypothetical protein